MFQFLSRKDKLKLITWDQLIFSFLPDINRLNKLDHIKLDHLGPKNEIFPTF